MNKALITSLTAFCFVTISLAQDYNTGIGLMGGPFTGMHHNRTHHPWHGIGLRGGPFTGLTVKHFVSEKAAIEFLLASRWRGFEVTGLYEIHNRAFDTDRLKWYYGFGAHAGFYDGDHTYWGERGRRYNVLGLDGILGLEYSFTEIPINLSIDWKPTLNFYGYTGFWGDGGALSIRYIF